jgi:hypothetical protein
MKIESADARRDPAASRMDDLPQFARMDGRKAGKMELVLLDEGLGMKFIERRSEIVHAKRAVGATLGDSA